MGLHVSHLTWFETAESHFVVQTILELTIYPSLPQTHSNSSVSASRILEFPACTTTPGWDSHLIILFFCLSWGHNPSLPLASYGGKFLVLVLDIPSFITYIFTGTSFSASGTFYKLCMFCFLLIQNILDSSWSILASVILRSLLTLDICSFLLMVYGFTCAIILNCCILISCIMTVNLGGQPD